MKPNKIVSGLLTASVTMCLFSCGEPMIGPATFPPVDNYEAFPEDMPYKITTLKESAPRPYPEEISGERRIAEFGKTAVSVLGNKFLTYYKEDFSLNYDNNYFFVGFDGGDDARSFASLEVYMPYLINKNGQYDYDTIEYAPYIYQYYYIEDSSPFGGGSAKIYITSFPVDLSSFGGEYEFEFRSYKQQQSTTPFVVCNTEIWINGLYVATCSVYVCSCGKNTVRYDIAEFLYNNFTMLGADTADV